jgi:hypothetical protein
MIYDTGEYDIQLEIPTKNFALANLYPRHLEQILEHVGGISMKDENTLIVLLGAFQCIQERDFWIKPLDNFCKSIANPVVVFTGKLTPDSEYSLPDTSFAYNRISMFDLVSNFHWNRRIENINRNWTQDCFQTKTKKFYWSSSKDWYTRRFILAGLINNDLIKDGLVNYKCIHTDIPGPWVQHQVEQPAANYINEQCIWIANRVPLPALDNTVEFSQTNVNFYLDSYLGIVADTFFDNGVFLSEKVFNAMNYQQLFFYIGHHGSLQYLRDQGYCTFDDVIDTSYDSILESGRRLIAARESLLKFLDQPLEKIRLAYQKCTPGIRHNKNLVMQQRPDQQFTQLLAKAIDEH